MVNDNNDLTAFCRLIRKRSIDHKDAIGCLYNCDMDMYRELAMHQPPEARHHYPTSPSVLISILREELDSMVRVIYLLKQSDIEYRLELIRLTLEGKKWTHKDSSNQVRDFEMVDLAKSLHGWPKLVYGFGCRFIHLSNYHDYETTDPVSNLTSEDKIAIYNYMNEYHHMSNEEFSFQDLIFYLPDVFSKISGNLEHYLKELENDVVLNEE